VHRAGTGPCHCHCHYDRDYRFWFEKERMAEERMAKERMAWNAMIEGVEGEKGAAQSHAPGPVQGKISRHQ